MRKEEWEELARMPKGHDKVVAKLKDIVRSKGQKGYPKLVPFTDRLRRELWIASKHRVEKEYHYVAYEPDMIITLGTKPEDRIFIEYVNTEGKSSSNCLRCIRGMRALECVMRIRGLKAKAFVLALRDSFADYYIYVGVPASESLLDIMSLRSLLKRLEGTVEW